MLFNAERSYLFMFSQNHILKNIDTSYKYYKQRFLAWKSGNLGLASGVPIVV